jgi:hypothetical protein
MQNKPNWDDRLRPAARTCSRGDAETRRKARLNPSGPLRPGVSARGIKCEVENKPNLAGPGQRRVCDGERCETKPIPGGVGQPSLAPRPSGLAPGPEAVVQTKPIPGEARWDEARGAWVGGQMRQTKPIPGGATERVSALWERSYG